MAKCLAVAPMFLQKAYLRLCYMYRLSIACSILTNYGRAFYLRAMVQA